MYDIAARFPLEARREAAKREYTSWDGCARRDDEEHCPVGVIFHHMGIPSDPAPEYEDAATLLSSRTGDPREIVEEEMWSFVADWDEGVITDLAEALGVTANE